MISPVASHMGPSPGKGDPQPEAPFFLDCSSMSSTGSQSQKFALTSLDTSWTLNKTSTQKMKTRIEKQKVNEQNDSRKCTQGNTATSQEILKRSLFNKNKMAVAHPQVTQRKYNRVHVAIYTSVLYCS